MQEFRARKQPVNERGRRSVIGVAAAPLPKFVGDQPTNADAPDPAFQPSHCSMSTIGSILGHRGAGWIDMRPLAQSSYVHFVRQSVELDANCLNQRRPPCDFFIHELAKFFWSPIECRYDCRLDERLLVGAVLHCDKVRSRDPRDNGS